VAEGKAQAKVKALVKKRAAQINPKGDDLMYNSVKNYTAPTITGGK
jgi:hypothetical protein